MDVESDEDSKSSPSIASEVAISVARASTGDSTAPMMNHDKSHIIDDFVIPSLKSLIHLCHFS